MAPSLVICLGATATHAFLGGKAALTGLRGRILRPAPEGLALLATVHPSYVLRVPSAGRDQAFEALVADLKLAARFLRELG